MGVEGEVVVGKDKFCELEEDRVGGWVWGGRWSRKYSRAERPWVWGMLVYREETSTVTMMVSGGRGVGRDRIVSRKWLVSWTWEGRDLTNSWRWASM